MSKIEWTDKTWNPVRGCSRVSPGCDHCYAMRMAHRQNWRTPADETGEPARSGGYHGLTIYRERSPRAGVDWSGVVRLVPEMLELPRRWKKSRLIFVNSMSDLFHESLTNEEIAAVFGIMAACPWHTFQVLTKRAKRMKAWFDWANQHAPVHPASDVCVHAAERAVGHAITPTYHAWPLPNVVLLVSAENQKMADERLPYLLCTPAAVRGVSIEPMLGPVDLDHWLWGDRCPDPQCGDSTWDHDCRLGEQRLHWVIVGGESGAGARPMHPDWARSLRDQCAVAGVPFFFKQWGEWSDHGAGAALTSRCKWIEHNGTTHDFHPSHLLVAPPASDALLVGRLGKKRTGRLLDGVKHDEYPEVRRDRAA